jgi:isoleucyl-tRNA synthetase
VANQGTLTVALDITLTPGLVEEGLARELVNRIQNLRKDKGFDVTDKIKLTIRKNRFTGVGDCKQLWLYFSETLCERPELFRLRITS